MPPRLDVLAAFSRRAIHDMDRHGGAEYMLPWPPWLPIVEEIPEDGERDASPLERAAATAIVGGACRAAGLVLRRVTVARICAPARREPEYRLVLTIVGTRFAAAAIGSSRRGRDIWPPQDKDVGA